MKTNLVTLGDLCDKYGGIIRTGPFGSQLHQSDYKTEGIPVIMPKDIINGKIQTDSIARIGPNDAKRLVQHSLKKGDIVYGRRGDIGRRAIITEKEIGWICGTGCLRISLNLKVIEPLYLYYYLGQKDVSDWIYNQAIGATLPNLNTQIIRSVEINCLPFQIQQKIAAILSSYDNLIENNKRRITVLEKMAEEIYREWFVCLRFPGYNNTEFVKGIPKGWELTSIGEIISFYIGGGWGKDIESLEFSKPAYVIRGTDIPDIIDGNYTKNLLRYHKPSNYNSRKIFEDDIIFEVSGGSKEQLLGRTLHISKGLLQFFENNVICASFCKLLRPDKKKISALYLKYFFKIYYESGLVGTFQTQSTGISNYHFEDFLKYQTLIVPTMNILNAFDDIVANLLIEKDVLALKNNILKSTRDLLLYRLLSGKLSVEDLDIQFPKSMEDDYAELHQ